MLPPFIIDQIRRREEEERRRIQYEQPRLELPVERRRPRVEDEEEAEERAERGVIILDLA